MHRESGSDQSTASLQKVHEKLVVLLSLLLMLVIIAALTTPGADAFDQIALLIAGTLALAVRSLLRHSR